MTPSVVLNVEMLGDSAAALIAAEIASATDHKGKCTTRSAPLVARRRRCLSSPDLGDPCIAAIATPKLGPGHVVRQSSKKGG